ncbi:M48 family metalloprotease [Bradyrhizobium pachyrhizi]|uniref:M48 family metalloprotease n=1 Tax=Bradyrhizobium pachyrhizi TaxID=280333 RepID=UPI003D36C7F4
MIRTARALRILTVANAIELLLVLICLFPDVAVGLFFLLQSISNVRAAADVAAPLVGLPAAIIFCAGLLFDVIRDRTSLPKTIALPDEAKDALPGFADGSVINPNRVRVVMGDLSVGARVSGLIRPKVVISGGLLYGLMTGYEPSRAIFGHEVGHIRNGDRWLFGLIAVALTLACIQILDLLFPVFLEGTHFGDSLRGVPGDWETAQEFGLSRGYPSFVRWLSILVHLIILSFILHWREYAADAVGASLLGSRVGYCRFLMSLKKAGGEPVGPGHTRAGAFFHPSIEERTRKLGGTRSALGTNTGLIIVWSILLLAGVGLISLLGSIDPLSAFAMPSLRMVSMSYVGFAGLVIELVKFGAIRSDEEAWRATVARQTGLRSEE